MANQRVHNSSTPQGARCRQDFPSQQCLGRKVAVAATVQYYYHYYFVLVVHTEYLP